MKGDDGAQVGHLRDLIEIATKVVVYVVRTGYAGMALVQGHYQSPSEHAQHELGAGPEADRVLWIDAADPDQQVRARDQPIEHDRSPE